MKKTQNLIKFSLSATDFPHLASLKYPCLCASCIPKPPRRPEPNTMSLDAFMPPAVNDLMEIYTPLHCRRHCGNARAITISTRTSQPTRRARVLAFLYRIMTFAHLDPDPAIHIRTYADTQRARCAMWLPVPLSTFGSIFANVPDLDLGFLIKLARHLDLSAYSNHLTPTPLYETWHIPAEIAVSTFDYIPRSDAKEAFDLADICAHLDALLPEAPTLYRKIASRVAWNPNPLDHWPWVPGWAPTQHEYEDHTISAGAQLIRHEIRRWWNFNPTPWLY